MVALAYIGVTWVYDMGVTQNHSDFYQYLAQIQLLLVIED